MQLTLSGMLLDPLHWRTVLDRTTPLLQLVMTQSSHLAPDCRYCGRRKGLETSVIGPHRVDLQLDMPVSPVASRDAKEGHHEDAQQQNRRNGNASQRAGSRRPPACLRDDCVIYQVNLDEQPRCGVGGSVLQLSAAAGLGTCRSSGRSRGHPKTRGAAEAPDAGGARDGT